MQFADWYDKDGDGCHTRAEYVKRVRKTSDCSVRTGKWVSKYDGQTFKRATNVDIDHMVPIAEAWGSGASKSDGDPAEWIPPRKKFRCDYAKQHTAVTYRWNLKVNKAERIKLRRTIKSCDDMQVLKPAEPTSTPGVQAAEAAEGDATRTVQEHVSPS